MAALRKTTTHVRIKKYDLYNALCPTAGDGVATSSALENAQQRDRVLHPKWGGPAMGVAFMASTSNFVEERGLICTFKRHFKSMVTQSIPNAPSNDISNRWSLSQSRPKEGYTSAIKERIASGTILSKPVAQLSSELRAPCRGTPRALSRCRQCTSTRWCLSVHLVSAMRTRRLDGRGHSGERAGRCGARPPRPRCCPPQPSTPP